MDIHRIFETIPYNVDQRISKELLPTLPSCFKQVPFYIGLPRLGMRGQYRCSCMNLHACDFGDHWEIHKDKNNPFTQPIEHLAEDAPNVLAAVTGAAILGALGLGCFLSKRPKDDRQSKKDTEQDRAGGPDEI